MKMSENEYSRFFNNTPYLVLEDVGFPSNYNLLSHEQVLLLVSFVDATVDRYAQGYIELLQSFRDDLESLSAQAKEVMDEINI